MTSIEKEIRNNKLNQVSDESIEGREIVSAIRKLDERSLKLTMYIVADAALATLMAGCFYINELAYYRDSGNVFALPGMITSGTATILWIVTAFKNAAKKKKVKKETNTLEEQAYSLIKG